MHCISCSPKETEFVLRLINYLEIIWCSANSDILWDCSAEIRYFPICAPWAMDIYSRYRSRNFPWSFSQYSLLLTLSRTWKPHIQPWCFHLSQAFFCMLCGTLSKVLEFSGQPSTFWYQLEVYLSSDFGFWWSNLWPWSQRIVVLQVHCKAASSRCVSLWVCVEVSR